MAFKNRIEFSAYSVIKKLGIFPLHLNLFTTSDVEKLVTSQNFSLLKAEKNISWHNYQLYCSEKALNSDAHNKSVERYTEENLVSCLNPIQIEL